MKTILMICTLVWAAAGSIAAQPKLTAVDEAGYKKLVASHKGKVVLVNFWATWCKPCRAEMPELVKMEQRLRARGFDLITISADDPAEERAAAKTISEYGIAGTTYIKQAADEDKYNVAIDDKWFGALPALFIYDRNGKKVHSFIGETPMKDVEAAITKLF
jgi:thiol-disulfide isomerase/thioredoxin